MHCRYVTMVTENGDIGIENILLEMSCKCVWDLNTKNGISK